MQLRILDFNYTFQSNVVISASSSNPEFPVSNISKSIRSSIWRSSGNFVITTSNQNLDFVIVNAGVQKTAVVTPGTYTPSGLATAIQVALTSADGANTYTVTYSPATGLWTILSSGSFLSLLNLSGTNHLTSIAAAIGFAISDATGSVTYTGSTIAIHTEEWILIDTLSPTSIDSFCLFFDAMRAVQLSSNAQLWIQASATNVWTSPVVNQPLTVDSTYDAAVNWWVSPIQYRYFRLRIVDPANVNLYVDCSKIFLSLATQLSRVQQNGWAWTETDGSQIMSTDYGHQYADLYPVKKQLDIVTNGVSYSDLQAIDKIFRRVGQVVPIVIAIDPLAEVYLNDHFLIYGVFNGAWQPTQMYTSNFTQPISLMEVF